jgi:hypothetical protein
VALNVPQRLADITRRFLKLAAHVLELLVDLLGELADLILHEGKGGVIGLRALQFLDPAGSRFNGADERIQEKNEDDRGDDHHREDKKSRVHGYLCLPVL